MSYRVYREKSDEAENNTAVASAGSTNGVFFGPPRICLYSLVHIDNRLNAFVAATDICTCLDSKPDNAGKTR